MKFSTLLIVGILFITNLNASTYTTFADPFGSYEITIVDSPFSNLKGQLTVSKVDAAIQVTFKAENNQKVYNLKNVQLVGDNLTGDFNLGGTKGTISLQFFETDNFTGSVSIVDNTAVSSFNNMELKVSGTKQE